MFERLKDHESTEFNECGSIRVIRVICVRKIKDHESNESDECDTIRVIRAIRVRKIKRPRTFLIVGNRSCLKGKQNISVIYELHRFGVNG